MCWLKYGCNAQIGCTIIHMIYSIKAPTVRYIFEIFIHFERLYLAKLDFIAANDPYRADTLFTRTRRVERCSRSVTRSRRSESPCLLVRKRRKERMEIRHFRPIVSLRALAFANGETSCYSISMQRVFNEEARRFLRHAALTLIDYGNWFVAKFDDEFQNEISMREQIFHSR